MHGKNGQRLFAWPFTPDCIDRRFQDKSDDETKHASCFKGEFTSQRHYRHQSEPRSDIVYLSDGSNPLCRGARRVDQTTRRETSPSSDVNEDTGIGTNGGQDWPMFEPGHGRSEAGSGPASS